MACTAIPFVAWVAELNGHVVGHIGLSRSGAGEMPPVLWSRRESVPVEDTAVIRRLFVSPSARGHGIGALLMARAVQDAQNRALRRVLDVLASDTSAAARIADRRRDGLHKLTTRLVRENQTIVIEDLTVRNMVRNRSLPRAISDAAWAEFRGLLEYKAQWYGREVIAVDRFFPSSKLCSVCGTLQDKMPQHVRTWACACGTTHDRDVNAARNLLAAGRAVSACGAGVRPQRRTPGGQRAMKREVSRREP
ncbi:RNA-guided endonuclease TnpB family protein [Streptomyces sp. NPDC006539]|uniref:RNA-guided endonuclease TnpB family protein n=1 Tax=Streptomyces sp. NPDC006539 TaxID=3155352 RepID=UPI0033AF4634